MAIKILAAVLVDTSSPLKIIELSVPELMPGQVLVDIAYSGICRSQLNEARGKRGVDKFLPHVMGHEGSGIVKAVGPEVCKVKPGDPVVMTWIRGRGANNPSTNYKSELGVINSGAVSTFMEMSVVSENCLVSVTPEMPLLEAALLGCAVPTGGGMINNTLGVKEGDSIVVFGAGGIGNCAIMMAKNSGAHIVVAVDISENKLNKARAFGATHVVNAKSEDPVAYLHDLTDGVGVDFAVEAVGNPKTIEQAVASVRFKTGVCVIAGNPEIGERFSIDPYDLIKGKRILGSWGGETDPDTDIPNYANMFLQGELDLTKLISRKYSLENVNQALEDLELGRVTRAMLKVN